jgi:hypothetical protein
VSQDALDVCERELVADENAESPRFRAADSSITRFGDALWWAFGRNVGGLLCRLSVSEHYFEQNF